MVHFTGVEKPGSLQLDLGTTISRTVHFTSA